MGKFLKWLWSDPPNDPDKVLKIPLQFVILVFWAWSMIFVIPIYGASRFIQRLAQKVWGIQEEQTTERKQ